MDYIANIITSLKITFLYPLEELRKKSEETYSGQTEPQSSWNHKPPNCKCEALTFIFINFLSGLYITVIHAPPDRK
jgi:hypothetical protein